MTKKGKKDLEKEVENGLKVVKSDEKPNKPKKPTKAEIKKAEREEKELQKARDKAQKEQMEKQIKDIFQKVSTSKCNNCLHCMNPNKTFDRVKVKSTQGEELFAPMNYCKLAGLSLVDVQECEKFDARPKNQD